MVRYTLGIIALALLCLGFSNGGLLQHRRTASRASSSGSGDSCANCTNETFEGTGTSVAGWKYGDGSEGVVTNVDYTTSPAPLIGSQSALLKNPDSQAATLNLVIPSSAQVDVRWTMVITNTVVNNMRVLKLDDNVGTAMLEIQVQATSLRVVHGTANATTVSDLVAGTQYYCWATYVKGSGANGVGRVAFSTSKTKPTGGNDFAEVTNGSRTANVTDFYCIVNDVSFGSGISGIIYDNISISVGGSIGDFP